jgi:alkanesulfonate monooxygenase SsuD/methylene tetrahydromethanopterin reductase-like flavin-dependent oxidoreductase (luciferase family)
MHNHGTDPSRRFTLMRERVEAMKTIWTDEEASYAGQYVRFDRIWSWPKPVQKPHPPVMIAGNGSLAERHVLTYGDEWLPEPGEGLVHRIRELRETSRGAGRDPVPVTVYGASVEDVKMYEEAGVHRCVYWLPPPDADDTLSPNRGDRYEARTETRPQSVHDRLRCRRSVAGHRAASILLALSPLRCVMVRDRCTG